MYDALDEEIPPMSLFLYDPVWKHQPVGPDRSNTMIGNALRAYNSAAGIPIDAYNEIVRTATVYCGDCKKVHTITGHKDHCGIDGHCGSMDDLESASPEVLAKLEFVQGSSKDVPIVLG